MGLWIKLASLALLLALCNGKGVPNTVTKELVALDMSQIKEGQQVFVIKAVSNEAKEAANTVADNGVTHVLKAAPEPVVKTANEKPHVTKHVEKVPLVIPAAAEPHPHVAKAAKKTTHGTRDHLQRSNLKKSPPPLLIPSPPEEEAKEEPEDGEPNLSIANDDCSLTRAIEFNEDAVTDPRVDPARECPDSPATRPNKWEYKEGLGCFLFDGGESGCKGSWSMASDYCKHLNHKGSQLIEAVTPELADYIKRYAVNVDTNREVNFGEGMKIYESFMKTEYAVNISGELTDIGKRRISLLPTRATRQSGPWLGATDIALEGHWMWDISSRVMNKTFFHEGSIFDDIGPLPGPRPGEDCLELFSSDGKVNDLNCDFWRLNPLCHIPEELLPHPNGTETPPTGRCPDGWDKLEPHGCFFHVQNIMTWDDAFLNCPAFQVGSFLAEPTTKEALMAVSKRYGKENSWTKHNRASGPWLGANDREVEGSWVWATSKLPVVPDQLGSNGAVFADDEGPTYGEDVMELFNNKGLVNDLNGTFWQLTSLCQLPLKY